MHRDIEIRKCTRGHQQVYRCEGQAVHSMVTVQQKRKPAAGHVEASVIRKTESSLYTLLRRVQACMASVPLKPAKTTVLLRHGAATVEFRNSNGMLIAPVIGLQVKRERHVQSWLCVNCHAR